MNLVDKWEPKLAEVALVDHKATLPVDYKEIIQVAYRNSTLQNSKESWVAMRSNSSTTFQMNCDAECTSYSTCTSFCPQEYTTFNGVLTSSLRTATLLVSYFGYPVDDKGDHLIPDDETVKEAIFHYVLYRYWLQKDLMKESGADKRMMFHLQMWSTLSRKAQSLNLPNLGQMENIRANRSRLVSNSHAFDNFFGSLGANQHTTF